VCGLVHCGWGENLSADQGEGKTEKRAHSVKARDAKEKRSAEGHLLGGNVLK